MTPPISRVAQATDEMGQLAAKMLLNRLDNKNEMVSHVELSAELIIRNSISHKG